MASKSLITFEKIQNESPHFLDTDSHPNWQAHFGNDHPLKLEIGFGNGKFLLEMAIREPEFNFIGLDFYHRGIRKVISRIENLQLKNLCIVYGDAREKVPTLFHEGEMKMVYINFPDPWPKKRHIKRRLIKPAFVSLLASRLMPGGEAHLATDSEPYAWEMLSYLETDPAFKNQVGRNLFLEERDHFPVSKYEKNFINAGEKIYYLDFVKE